VITSMLPHAARLVCGVAEHNPAETHAVLEPLDIQQLRTLAVILAASVDPEKPLGQLDTPIYVGTVARVVRAVAYECDVDATDIYDRSREADVIDARHIVCWVASAMGLKSTEIGKALHRDHSTVLNSCARVTSQPDLHRVANRVLDDIQRREREAA
jgi:hypothetical protein